MRRAHRLLIIGISLLLQGCGIAGMVCDITQREKGYALLRDGSRVEGFVRIPDAESRHVRIKPYDAPARRIPAEEVEALYVHRAKYPDKVHVLAYMDSESPTMFSTGDRKDYPPRWVVRLQEGDKLCFYTLGQFYSIARDGEMNIVSQTGGDIEFIARKSRDKKGFRVGIKGGSPQRFRESLKQYLSDDAALCKEIDARHIKHNDFGKISQTYNPQW